MRVAIGEFIHETDSFCAHKTALSAFYEQGEFCETGIIIGNDIIDNHEGLGTGTDGFIKKCRQYEWEIVPTITAETLPSGTIEKAAYEFIKGTMIDKLSEAEVDAMLLHLHGAALVEDMDDCEGDLLESIKKQVGDIPLVVIYDLHANVTPLMVKCADIMLGYNEEPHIDIYDRAMEAGDILKKIFDGDIVNPITKFNQPPMILPAINMATANNPMKALFEMAYEWEKHPEVINVSIFGGFYGSDQYNAGPCIVATVENNAPLASEIVQKIGLEMWERRHEFIVECKDIDETVRKALDEGGVWALIDEADDPAGGGSCDGTEILASFIRHNLSSAGIATICDREVVEKAFELGLGAEIDCFLGCKTDDLHGETLHITGKVDHLRTDPIPWGTWEDADVMQNVGRTVVIDISGIKVIVTEMKAVTEDIDIFEMLGYDVTKMNALGLKGLGLHIKKAYGSKIDHYIPADGKGVTHPDLRKIGTYYNIRRPVFPLDSI